MAGPAPIKLYGLNPHISNTIASRNTQISEWYIRVNVTRLQIIAILTSNGIKVAKIRTKHKELIQKLHRLIVDQGAEACEEDDEDAEFDRQQANSRVPRPLNCCICMGRVSNVLYTLCRHLCTCSTCKGAMLRGQNAYPNSSIQRQINCPVCRHVHNEDQLMRVLFNDA